MGQFMGIAERLAGQIAEFAADSEGLTRKDLGRLVGQDLGPDINCYPGEPTDACHPVAVFLSITDPGTRKGRRGHLGFAEALKKLVQHMQGACEGRTRAAVLIADGWDAVACHEWQANLRRIRSGGALIEMYLIRGGRCWEIDS